MARGINKVILIGNLGADPEVRYMPNGSPVANLSVATSESWQDKQTGEKQERTEWHRVIVFRRLAEIASEYLRKGGKVYVEGRLRTRKWQDQSGVERYTTEIVADELQMLDRNGAPGREMNQPSLSQYGNDPMDNLSGSNPLEGNAASSSHKKGAPEPVNMGEDFDDDIPF